MAQVSKDGPTTPPGGDAGAAGPDGGPAPAAGTSPASPATPAAPQPPRHNLPMKTAPIVGRRTEMQAIAKAFETARRGGRAGRVEIVGRPGIGTTTVAVELARRAGVRFPGGAWFIDAALGPDLAWADVAAARGRGRVKNLAAAVREEKEKFAEGPQGVLVIDGVRDADDLLACLPLESRTPPFVFVTCAKPTGSTEDVVEVSDVPPQGARRICQTMLHGADGAPPAPQVRALGGLGLTASLAARAAMALQGRAGPLLIDDVRNGAMRIVPLIAGTAACLEILLITSVMHPNRIPVDAIFGAVTAVRRGRGAEPKPEEIGQSVLLLARAGLVDPQDDRRVSMHPLVQEVVREMAKTPEDLRVAREAAAAGMCEEAEASIGDDGVDVTLCGLHQLRFLEPLLEGEPQADVREVREKLERALGVVS